MSTNKKNYVDYNNSVNLVGFLCKDITLSTTKSGKTEASIMLNVKQGKDSEGKAIYEPVFMKCWGERAENMAAEYKAKALVKVCGRISSRFVEGKYNVDIIADSIEKQVARENKSTEADKAVEAAFATDTTEPARPAKANAALQEIKKQKAKAAKEAESEIE